MSKILLWDYVGVSAAWVDDVVEKNNVEILRTITPQDSLPDILLEKNSWDWLLIFSYGIMRDDFDEIVRALKLPPDKVIYVFDMGSWLNHAKAIFELINPVSGRCYFSILSFALNRYLNDFVACTVEGLSYVATAQDSVIMNSMYTTRQNWAADDMQAFHALTKRFYGTNDDSGYFLDLGANIGTTGIYFTKKLAPNLKLFAVEPDPENFKLLRTNLILNDLEHKTTAVNCGLGNKFDTLTMYRDLANPGNCNLFDFGNGFPTETIQVAPLDTLLAENKISPAEVKYIWIDAQGFEPQILLGAEKLLAVNPAPAFVEFNARVWHQSGYFEDLMTLLAKHYSHFVHFNEDSSKVLYPLATLREIQPSGTPLGTIGDIFLIRKGAVD